MIRQTTKADQAVADAVERQVQAYHAAFAEARYRDAIDLMAPGMTVYAPYGVAQTVIADKAATTQVYEDIHARGFRLQETPQYIQVQVLPNNIAVATYLTQGTSITPDTGTTSQTLRRSTQVWQQTDAGWNIVHMHVSNLEMSEELLA